MHRPAARLLIAAAWLSLGVSAASAQALYKSVGPNGKVVYSDMPPAQGAAHTTLKLDNLPVSVVPGAALAPNATSSNAPTAAPAAAPRGEVVLYMAKWCGYCTAAKAYLARHRIAYRELDIDTPGGKAAFAQLGVRGIPVLLTQGRRISGFTPQAYDAVFLARK